MCLPQKNYQIIKILKRDLKTNKIKIPLLKHGEFEEKNDRIESFYINQDFLFVLEDDDRELASGNMLHVFKFHLLNSQKFYLGRIATLKVPDAEIGVFMINFISFIFLDRFY